MDKLKLCEVFPCHMKSSKAQNRSISLATLSGCPFTCILLPSAFSPYGHHRAGQVVEGGQVGSSKGKCRVDKGNVD